MYSWFRENYMDGVGDNLKQDKCFQEISTEEKDYEKSNSIQDIIK